jgi:hypothetical protein
MFAIEKRERIKTKGTITDLIQQLQKLPPHYCVTICGDAAAFIHVDDEDQYVTLDSELLDEYYYEYYTDEELEKYAMEKYEWELFK